MSAPVVIAIAVHRAAYDAFQVAPDGEPALQAEDAYDAASGALVATTCGSREDAVVLLAHLRWWLAEEAEFRESHQPAYSTAEARVADLALAVEQSGPASVGDDWQPIETVPPEIEWEADLPDNAAEGMGWACGVFEDEFLFLVWWEQTAPGVCKVTKWRRLPAGPHSETAP